jgi:hypothetical protein
MQLSDLAKTGPVGYRQGVLQKTCEVFVEHLHNYDHATFIHRGRVLVVASREVIDDDGTKRLVEVNRREYAAGEFVAIPANLIHNIKALEDNTVFFCLFSHRDFEGLCSQAYVGNAAAYQ